MEYIYGYQYVTMIGRYMYMKTLKLVSDMYKLKISDVMLFIIVR